jgi:hypothetical protein
MSTRVLQHSSKIPAMATSTIWYEPRATCAPLQRLHLHFQVCIRSALAPGSASVGAGGSSTTVTPGRLRSREVSTFATASCRATIRCCLRRHRIRLRRWSSGRIRPPGCAGSADPRNRPPGFFRNTTAPAARADLKVEVKARKWLTDVAVVCPATKSVVARQNTHLHPGVSAKAGEAVKTRRGRSTRGRCRGLCIKGDFFFSFFPPCFRHSPNYHPITCRRIIGVYFR